MLCCIHYGDKSLWFAVIYNRSLESVLTVYPIKAEPGLSMCLFINYLHAHTLAVLVHRCAVSWPVQTGWGAQTARGPWVWPPGLCTHTCRIWPCSLSAVRRLGLPAPNMLAGCLLYEVDRAPRWASSAQVDGSTWEHGTGIPVSSGRPFPLCLYSLLGPQPPRPPLSEQP